MYGLFLTVLHASSHVISPGEFLTGQDFSPNFSSSTSGIQEERPAMAQPTDKKGNPLLDWYRCRREMVHLHPLGETRRSKFRGLPIIPEDACRGRGPGPGPRLMRLTGLHVGGEPIVACDRTRAT